VEALTPLDRVTVENARIGLQNQVRATLLQAFAGAFFLVTAFLTWHQIQVNREGQTTERFTRAIDHLGTDDKLDVRLGGIYALERIADASRSEHGAIVEILTAYVRGHAAGGGPEGELAGLAPLHVRAADIQAAMTVLGRRQVMAGDPGVLQLAGLDLRRATLTGADLREADLSGADLSGSLLETADLRGANLENARLVEARMPDARLAGALLKGADLTRAQLVDANLEGAALGRVNLYGADLRDARLARTDLSGANLGQARLHGANLRGAILHDANLWEANLAGADLRGADLDRSSLVRADLGGANADDDTVWPRGFDWSAAGVTVAQR
jgi:uncharacterized protein YjbI with pentapeptide repeats